MQRVIVGDLHAITVDLTVRLLKERVPVQLWVIQRLVPPPGLHILCIAEKLTKVR